MIRINKSLILLFLITTGCAPKPVNSPPTASNPNTPNRSTPAVEDRTNLPQPPPDAELADGWIGFTINANSAKTAISTQGHFSTSRNACGKEAAGVIALDDWNRLAKNLNTVVKLGASTEDYCIPIPETYPYMNDTVEVQLEQGKRTLYENKDGQICSRIADRKISDNLLADIQKMILQADKEECPNGWGSA